MFPYKRRVKSKKENVLFLKASFGSILHWALLLLTVITFWIFEPNFFFLSFPDICLFRQRQPQNSILDFIGPLILQKQNKSMGLALFCSLLGRPIFIVFDIDKLQLLWLSDVAYFYLLDWETSNGNCHCPLDRGCLHCWSKKSSVLFCLKKYF